MIYDSYDAGLQKLQHLAIGAVVTGRCFLGFIGDLVEPPG
jgi:hypothetical protein